MNMDFIRNHPEAANIPKEKLDFLLRFADQNFSGNANQLASQLSSAANTAKEKGYTFNQDRKSVV